jgi:hypothetical protein
MSAAVRKILSFDTSGINRLADDFYSDALVAGLKSGYFVRFPFTTVSEVIANSSGARRAQLLRVCRALLAVAGDCIEPHQEILKIMVARFEKSLPLGLEHVYLRMNVAEDEILRAENFDDDLAAQERTENRINDKVYVGMFANAKVAFDALANSGIEMPRSVAELVARLQQGGAFWTLARNLIERVATKPIDDIGIKKFYAECEPFRALMIAIFAAQYDRCVRQRSENRSLKAGRNDTFMATCLPYCDEFITDDDGQLACYEEVVSLTGIGATIRSYDEFRNSFFVLGATVNSAS